MESNENVSRLLNMYKTRLSRRSPDNYFSIIEEEIPDMLSECESEDMDESLKLTAPLVSIAANANTSFFENQSSASDSDISVLPEIVEETNRVRGDTNNDLSAFKNSQSDCKYHAPNVSYASHECNLSADDCIKKSILYADLPSKASEGSRDADSNVEKLPAVFSATSDVGYPVDDNSVNEGTYSVVEELPSDCEKMTFSISDDAISTDDERAADLKFSMMRYPDSFDESESSRSLKRNHYDESVFQYLQNCLDAGERMKESVAKIASKKPIFEDVVGKVINQYHNLTSRKNDARIMSAVRSDSLDDSSSNGGWSSASSISGKEERSFNSSSSLRSGTTVGLSSWASRDSRSESSFFLPRAKLEDVKTPSRPVCSPVNQRYCSPNYEFSSPLSSSNPINDSRIFGSVGVSDFPVCSSVSSGFDTPSFTPSKPTDVQCSNSMPNSSCISSPGVRSTPLSDSFCERFENLCLDDSLPNCSLNEIILEPPDMFRTCDGVSQKESVPRESADDKFYVQFDLNDNITSVGLVNGIDSERVLADGSHPELRSEERTSCCEFVRDDNRSCAFVEPEHSVKLMTDVSSDENDGIGFECNNNAADDDESVLAKYDVYIGQTKSDADNSDSSHPCVHFSERVDYFPRSEVISSEMEAPCTRVFSTDSPENGRLTQTDSENDDVSPTEAKRSSHILDHSKLTLNSQNTNNHSKFMRIEFSLTDDLETPEVKSKLFGNQSSLPVESANPLLHDIKHSETVRPPDNQLRECKPERIENHQVDGITACSAKRTGDVPERHVEDAESSSKKNRVSEAENDKPFDIEISVTDVIVSDRISSRTDDTAGVATVCMKMESNASTLAITDERDRAVQLCVECPVLENHQSASFRRDIERTDCNVHVIEGGLCIAVKSSVDNSARTNSSAVQSSELIETSFALSDVTAIPVEPKSGILHHFERYSPAFYEGTSNSVSGSARVCSTGIAGGSADILVSACLKNGELSLLPNTLIPTSCNNATCVIQFVGFDKRTTLSRSKNLESNAKGQASRTRIVAGESVDNNLYKIDGAWNAADVTSVEIDSGDEFANIAEIEECKSRYSKRMDCKNGHFNATVDSCSSQDCHLILNLTALEARPFPPIKALQPGNSLNSRDSRKLKLDVADDGIVQPEFTLTRIEPATLRQRELKLFDLSDHVRRHSLPDLLEMQPPVPYQAATSTASSAASAPFVVQPNFAPTDDGLAGRLADESARWNGSRRNLYRDSISEESDVLITSAGELDGMPNPSSRERDTDTVTNNSDGGETRRIADKQVAAGGGRRQPQRRLVEAEEADAVPVAEHGEQHATVEALLASDNSGGGSGSLAYNLDECGCWKSLSNDARSDLRKWRTLPRFAAAAGEIMRSLNSSKLDLTGRVPPELCILKARNRHRPEYVFAAPLDERCFFGVCDSVVRDLIFGVDEPCDRGGATSDPDPDPAKLCVSNIEAIREFSDYFKQSLETDSKLREGIPDLSLDGDLSDCCEPSTCGGRDDVAARPVGEQDDKVDEDRDQVTSFVFSSPSSSSCGDLSIDESVPAGEMKNKKKGAGAEETSIEADDPASRPGILKSALKRGSKKFYRKKHRVQFDESLNKFFEADYVILVRDEEYEDDYGRCECGNQFCYEGCYYEDGEDDEYEHSVDSPRFDFAAAFDPPMEFVDPVTLSPPDGYKDGCCPEPGHKVSTATMTCGDNEDADQGVRVENREKLRNESPASNDKGRTQEHVDDCYGAKKDLSNHGYPFHPNDINASSQLALFNDSSVPTNGQSRYIVETITMTTVTERRIVRESNDQIKVGDILPDKYNNGILKGGKLWRNQETGGGGSADECKMTESAASELAKTEDDKRSVKFIQDDFNDESCDKNENYEKGEFTLTFKLGNRVVPCNSLKPNSAVRQLFPDPRFVNPPTAISEIDCDDNLGKCEGKYLVTEESLRAFNEVNKRSVFATFSGKERYPYKDANFTVHSDDEDIPQNDLIKKTIERNTLRRSLMRYPHGENRKRGKKKLEVSLEERIKQLTCNIDDEQVTSSAAENVQTSQSMSQRTSPPGEESQLDASCKADKSAYKKFTDLFRNKSESQTSGAEQHYPYYQPVYQVVQPDLGVDVRSQVGTLISAKKPATNEARKQFLSSLAPLTACVTGHVEPNYSNRETLKLKLPGDRHSIISTASTGTEYSIGDIDEALGKPPEEKAPQPDVVVGTPCADSGQDELAMFVQQDAGRIERIKKRYSNAPASTMSDDDEHDDYGFSRRPSVRGIKPRFGSTTEILQQMQAQLQPPLLTCPTKAGSHMTWPYYSAEVVDGKHAATSPRNPLPALKEEVYELNKQNATEYTAKVVWEKGAIPHRGPISVQQPLKVDMACNNVHMFRLTPSDSLTEVAMPYKCDSDPRRFPGNNIFQMKVSPVTPSQMRLPVNVPDGQFTAHPIPVGTTSVIRVGHGQQQTFRVPCPVSGPVQVHLLATHHYENPQIHSSQPIHFPPQIVVAKGTQTSTISTTSFYQLQTNSQSHYQNTGNATAALCKGNVNAEQGKLIQVNYTTAHPSPPISSLTSSPTRVKSQNNLTERGIPEGAVSSSPAFIQDCVKPQLSMAEASNNTQQGKPSSMMYGMKV